MHQVRWASERKLSKTTVKGSQGDITEAKEELGVY